MFNRETNLKCRQCLVETAEMGQDESLIGRFDGEIVCEVPNNLLNKFDGEFPSHFVNLLRCNLKFNIHIQYTFFNIRFSSILFLFLSPLCSVRKIFPLYSSCVVTSLLRIVTSLQLLQAPPLLTVMRCTESHRHRCSTCL